MKPPSLWKIVYIYIYLNQYHPFLRGIFTKTSEQPGVHEELVAKNHLHGPRKIPRNPPTLAPIAALIGTLQAPRRDGPPALRLRAAAALSAGSWQFGKKNTTIFFRDKMMDFPTKFMDLPGKYDGCSENDGGFFHKNHGCSRIFLWWIPPRIQSCGLMFSSEFWEGKSVFSQGE